MEAFQLFTFYLIQLIVPNSNNIGMNKYYSIFATNKIKQFLIVYPL